MSQNQPARGLELLTSWKEIASFMGKGVRTVQRWEATLGLPVIRPANSRSGIVMARPSDLEAWLHNGRQRSSLSPDTRRQRHQEARAGFSECVREWRSYQRAVKALSDQVNATRRSLKQEIEKLKFLYSEWDAIHGRVLRKGNPPASAKMN
jgi:hypothetical protein